MPFNPAAFLIQKKFIQTSEKVWVTALKGGYWNEVFLLETASFKVVLKRFFSETPRARLYPILPESEALALKVLAGLKIAPKFVAFFSEQTNERAVLIYEYVQGNLWQGDLSAVVNLMKRYHAQIPNQTLKGFRKLPTSPETILNQAGLLLTATQKDNHYKDLILLRPKPQKIPNLQTLSLVHTDAWLGNFIGSQESLYLIDWQCPGLGDPSEDVWTFLHSGYEKLIGLPFHSEAQKQAFLTTYYDNDTGSLERLELLSPFYAYRVAAHSLSRIQDLRTQNPEASQRYVQVFEHLLEGLNV